MDNMGNTPLHFLVANKVTDLVKFVDENGGDATLKNSNGQSSIEIAI